MPPRGRRPGVEVVVCPDPESLIERATGHVAAAAAESVRARGRFAVALAGGSTPRPLYERLSAQQATDGIDWPRVEVFWSDERCVPPDDDRSNYGAARAALLERVPLTPERIHRMRGEDSDADRAAAEYERVLRWSLGGGSTRPPRLDLVLLGLGREGHTASLFPGSPALDTARLVCAVRHAGDSPPYVDRLTLTPAVINAARAVVFLVAGREKADALRATIEGPRDPTLWPAQSVAPEEGRVTWYLDEAAAAGLTRASAGA